MFNRFMPKENRFFTLFKQQIATIQRGLDLFGNMLNNYDKRHEYHIEIKNVEKEADQVAHQIFHTLHNTFITPFDREDIQLLTQSLDDVIDLVEATSARMEIYDIPAPTDEVRELSRILRHSFKLISMAVEQLHDMKNRQQILNICVEINSLENEGDGVLRLSLRQLFKKSTDPLYVIKMKEILENLEEAIDRCEDLADIIETIIVKNA